MIQRTEYLNKLIAFRDKQLIKIVTGIRRCGKSTLLELYQQWLLQNGVEAEQILAINFEDLDYEELTDSKKLYAYLKAHLADGKMTYIFLDEIQNVPDFPKAVDSLYLKKNVDRFQRLSAFQRDRHAHCRAVCPDRDAAAFVPGIYGKHRQHGGSRSKVCRIPGKQLVPLCIGIERPASGIARLPGGHI